MDDTPLSPSDEVRQRMKRLQDCLDVKDAEGALVMAYAVEQLLARHPAMVDEDPELQACRATLGDTIRELEDQTQDIPSPPVPATPRERTEVDSDAADSAEISIETLPVRKAGQGRLAAVLTGMVLVALVFLSLPHLMLARENARMRDRMSGVIRDAAVRGYDILLTVEGSLHDRTLRYDVRNLPSDRSNEACYQLLARFAGRVGPQAFSKVLLCYQGEPRFEMPGGYFDKLSTLQAAARSAERLVLADNVQEIGKPAREVDPNATLQQQEEAFTELCEHWFASSKAGSQGQTSRE